MIFYTHECERAIGYEFRSQDLLRTAFTHSSYTNEHKGFKNNERLEFLGDSVLGFVVSEYLYLKQNVAEGIMTAEKQKLVSTKPLAEVVKRLKISEYLLVSENSIGGKISDKLCENLYEAIVGAIYLDGGLEQAKKFIERTLLNAKSGIKVLNDRTVDNKSALQMLLQSRYKNDFKLEYKEISKKGPAHKPEYVMGIYLNGKELARSKGSSKIEAEKDVAGKALKILNGARNNKVKGKSK